MLLEDRTRLEHLSRVKVVGGVHVATHSHVVRVDTPHTHRVVFGPTDDLHHNVSVIGIEVGASA